MAVHNFPAYQNIGAVTAVLKLGVIIAVANQVVLITKKKSPKNSVLCFREKYKKSQRPLSERGRGAGTHFRQKTFFHENTETLFSIDFFWGGLGQLGWQQQ